MKRRAELLEMPEHILFSLKDIAYSPESPRKEEPFTVTGKMELFGIPFPFPVWIIVTVTYPERWWEEITPIIGAREVREFCMALGGDFELTFKKGFLREGEFGLAVRLYPGPSFPIDTIVFTPTPAFATEETTFIVGGEVPPEEVGFRTFRILSYAKNGGAPVSPPEVLELDVGDRLQIKLGFDHRDLAVTGKIHAAIWQETFVDPHDEVLNKEKTFSVPASDDWEPHEEGIEIIITSDIAPGTEYGLYAKIMGITGGDIFTNYLENVITIIGPPELGFDLTKPTVSKTPVDPGTPIDITCPVKSTCSEPVDATAKVIIYEGSIAPGHGDTLKEYDSGVFHINPGETQNVILTNHVTVVGTIDRRDVEVEVYVEGRKIKESEWDDVFKVIQPKELQTLEVDITPAEGGYVTTEPKATEGHPEDKWYNNDTGKFEHDTRVRVTAHPNEGYEFDHWSDEIEGGVSYDNPEYVAGTMTEHRAVKAHFREIKLQTLEVDITPSGGGYVTTSPHADEGHPEERWYNNDTGKFEHDTRVRVTAHPNEGYEFDHWSDEIEGGTSTNNPEYVAGTMTEHRAVKAHFREIEMELLDVKIDPSGAGYVTVTPEPESGTEHNWYFLHGTTVYVTAHPNPGYQFKSWSGEMKDTTAITAPVYPMTEKRTITAHFEEEVVAEYTLSITIDPPGGGMVTKSPNKTRYASGEPVTLTATPSSGYKFDHWSGDASGYTPSVTIAMTRDKSVTAHFKSAVPDPTTKVSFTVKGDGFPFATSFWKLYHYDRAGNIWQDYTLHRPGDIIPVRNVQSAGKFSCHCCNLFTGEWSEQFYSVEFAAIDGEDYKYDIASGIVYYR